MLSPLPLHTHTNTHTHTYTIACRDPKAPEHGNVSLSQGIAQGSVANYSCQPPYILQGSENRTCSGGPEAPAWNGTDVVCIGKKCPHQHALLRFYYPFSLVYAT